MKKFWIIFGSIAGALAVTYLGCALFFMNHFFINTQINGRSFAGMKVADVEEYLKDEVNGYELTLTDAQGEKSVIKGTDISLKYIENDDIKNIKKSQNMFAWPSALFKEDKSKMEVEVSYDHDALDQVIAELPVMKIEQTAPVSAYPEYDGEKYVIVPEETGTKIDVELMTEKIVHAVMEFSKELDLEKEGCYLKPAFTKDSPEVKTACDTMNKYIGAKITYTMKDDVVVDKELISKWISTDDSMQVVFDDAAIEEWFTEFGDKYDTVGSTRSITTPGGKTAEVSGGTYGWSVNEIEEKDLLIEHIKNGETVSKEPVYYQTGASHSAQDWGTTYAEVDLSSQYMWYIVDGSVALETDIVTGYPSPEKETPAGVYSILEMEKNKTLVGAIQPETGKPEYETPVAYWMRVTWSGIGFHDATWQPAFGGSLYQTVGSHGCINMPLGQAEALYGMISVGTPVVVHY